MPETNDLTNILLVIGAVLGPLIALINQILQDRIHWPRWFVLPVSTAVSITALIVVIFLVALMLPTIDDHEKAPEKPRSAKQTANVPSSLASPFAFKTVAFLPQNDTEENDGEPRLETRERKVDHGKTNDHCAGARDVRWHFAASDGWQIDVTSIDIRATVVSSKSSYSGVVDATEEGFYVTGRIVNRGNCVKAFGTVIAKDARGTLRVAGTYRETRMVPATN